jgi:hypothetical protein
MMMMMMIKYNSDTHYESKKYIFLTILPNNLAAILKA